jgi:hypothetical protein
LFYEFDLTSHSQLEGPQFPQHNRPKSRMGNQPQKQPTAHS